MDGRTLTADAETTTETSGAPWRRLLKAVRSCLVLVAATIEAVLGIDWQDLTSRP